MANYNQTEDKALSEFNELGLKMVRIHKLQDRVNHLWQSPTEIWSNVSSVNGAPEYGYVLIIRALCSLWKEVRPKCTSNERGKAKAERTIGDEMRDDLSNKSEAGALAICKKGFDGDKKVLRYDLERWNNLRKEIDKFEDFVRDMLDEHGFTPNKSDVSGL